MATKEQIAELTASLEKIKKGVSELAQQEEIDKNIAYYGIDPSTVPESFKPALSAITDTLKKQFNTGSIASFDVQKALEVAQTDPDISAKYGDSLKLGTDAFTSSLQSYQSELTQGLSDYQRQFIDERKQLAETEANAGRAYSGFRGQAQEKLNREQSGIIQSARRKTQDALKAATSAFESKYGSSEVAKLGTSLNFLNPLTGETEKVSSPGIGDIMGTDVLGKKGDVMAKQADLLALNQTK